MQCLSVDFFVYIVFRIHWASWVYKLQFFTRFGKCSYIIYSSIFFFCPFLSLSSPPWNPIIHILQYLMLLKRPLRLVPKIFLQCILSLFLEPVTVYRSIFRLTDASAVSHLPSTWAHLLTFFHLSSCPFSSRISVWFLFLASISPLRFPVFHSFLVCFLLTVEYIFL